MYLTQPPFKHLTTHGMDSRKCVRLSEVQKSAWFEGGTTLGDLFQQIEELLQECDCVDLAPVLGPFQEFSNYAQLESLAKT